MPAWTRAASILLCATLLFTFAAATVAGPDLAAQDAAPDVAALKAKLDALEKAYRAGILTKEEYEAKKAEVEAQMRAAAPALDAATQAKLDALEKAYRAGILTEEEYERKKAEILKRAGAATPPPTAGTLGDLGPVRTDPERVWTILVYLDGDNDLEACAMRDLQEMELGLPAKGVEVLVLVDRAKGFAESKPDWTDALVLRIRPDRDERRLASEVLARPGELNMGDPGVLEAFVAAGLKAFPAPNTMLVLWDHGGGWASMASDHDAPGVAEGHDALTLAEVRQGIEGGLKKAGVEKLGVVGFDMCLMAQLEVAVELRDLAGYLVASEAIEPGDGWPFDTFLPVFGRGTMGSRRLVGEIVRAYQRFYEAAKSPVATLSAMDLSLAGEVATRLDAVLGSLEAAIPGKWAAIARSVYHSESYSSRTDVRRGPHAVASKDLLDALKRIVHASGSAEAKAAYRRLVDAMDRFVLASWASPRHRLSTGVAVYAPQHAKMLAPEYANTRFAAECAWAAFLGKIHARMAGAATKPTFANLRLTDNKGAAVSALRPLSNHRVRFDLDGTNVIWTQLWLCRPDREAGELRVLAKSYVTDPYYWTRRTEAVADAVDLVMPAYRDGKNDLFLDANGMTLLVTDGKTAYPATLDLSDLDDPEHIIVPAVYEHPSVGKLMASIYFHVQLGTARAVFVQVKQPDGRVMERQIRPDPAATITLLFETLDREGKPGLRAGGTMKWGDGPELVHDVLDPGAYRAVFIAETIDGTQSVGALPFEVVAHPAIADIKKSGKTFAAPQMIGTWDLHMLIGSDQLRPMGRTYELEANPERPGAVRGRLFKAGSKEHSNLVEMMPDMRLLPYLRIFVYGTGGEYESYLSGPAAMGVNREGKQVMVMHNEQTTLAFAWVKRGAPGGATGGATPPPEKPPETPPGSPLVGKWRGDEGDVLVCTATEVALYEDGEIAMRGVYRISGNRLHIDLGAGMVEEFVFQLRGDVLTVQDSEGDVYRYRRMK